jgi:hypothetical protein
MAQLHRVDPGLPTEFDNQIDSKNADIHVEQHGGHGAATDGATADELLKSRNDNLTVFQALWKFRRAAFFTFLVFTGYTIDGFEVSRSDYLTRRLQWRVVLYRIRGS